jgi:hypothetical protein
VRRPMLFVQNLIWQYLLCLFQVVEGLFRLALLVGTLDGCVQILSVRGDEAARTHKSKEWYWLDAAINAEYCSTYRDALVDGGACSRKIEPVQSAATASEPDAASKSTQSDIGIRHADGGNSKATVRCKF